MIYFIQDSVTLNVKIGFVEGDDEAVRRRRGELQIGNSSLLVVLATLPGARADESALHRRLAADRVGGEWFRPTPGLLEIICRARAAAARCPDCLSRVRAATISRRLEHYRSLGIRFIPDAQGRVVAVYGHSREAWMEAIEFSSDFTREIRDVLAREKDASRSAPLGA